MAANLKDIKSRITSVQKTRQITQAMKLVAGAKLKRATDAATNARPYQEQLAQVLGRVAARASSGGTELSLPLLTPREELKRARVVILTSDRGLCGAFNNNLLRRTLEFLESKRDAGIELDIKVYGRKGAAFLPSRGWSSEDAVLDWGNTPKMDLVRPLADDLVASFIEEQTDEVWLVYNEFVSTLTQRPRFFKLLPLEVDPEQVAAAAEQLEGGDYRFEPTAPEILGALLPLYLRTLILQAFLETEAGEYASRMTAMDAATRNASELIDSLTLEYNRARQAAITTEIIEIVSGAEAL